MKVTAQALCWVMSTLEVQKCYQWLNLVEIKDVKEARFSMPLLPSEPVWQHSGRLCPAILGGEGIDRGNTIYPVLGVTWSPASGH